MSNTEESGDSTLLSFLKQLNTLYYEGYNVLTVEHKYGTVQLPVIKFKFSRNDVTFYCYDLDGKTVLYFNGSKFTSNPKEFEDTIDKWALQDLDEIIEMNK